MNIDFLRGTTMLKQWSEHLRTLLAVSLAGLVVAMGLTTSQGLAQTANAPARAAAPAVPWASGEIRRVDKAAGKLSIRHGPLVNLDMPAMTMTFRVADPAMLERVKAGDRIRFVAGQANGDYTVERLELQNAPQ